MNNTEINTKSEWYVYAILGSTPLIAFLILAFCIYYICYFCHGGDRGYNENANENANDYTNDYYNDYYNDYANEDAIEDANEDAIEDANNNIDDINNEDYYI
jgi:hypothetical protein